MDRDRRAVGDAIASVRQAELIVRGRSQVGDGVGVARDVGHQRLPAAAGNAVLKIPRSLQIAGNPSQFDIGRVDRNGSQQGVGAGGCLGTDRSADDDVVAVGGCGAARNGERVIGTAVLIDIDTVARD